MEVLCCTGPTSMQTIQKVCKDVNVPHCFCSTTKAACQLVIEQPDRWIAIVTALGMDDDTGCWNLLEFVKKRFPSIYVIVYSYTAQCGDDPTVRLDCFKAGANMVTCYENALETILTNLKVENNTQGCLICPYCQKRNLSEDTLHLHLERYHTYQPNRDFPCPICHRIRPSKRGGFLVHYHNNHGPLERRENEKYIQGSLSSFALVVCQRPSDGRFLLVQEPLGVGGGYWLPAGRVDPGESLINGGIRETLEEAGIQIEIKSILNVSLTNALRVIYLAHPVEGSNVTPKTVPDFESAGAIWVSAESTASKLTPSHCRSGRATEPLIWFPKVAYGKQGLDINNEEYVKLENFVLKLGQKQCTTNDIENKLIPMVQKVNNHLT